MDPGFSPISTQEIVAFALGEADASTAARVRKAASADVSIAKDIELVQSMLATLREGVLVSAPASLKKAACELLSGVKAPTLAQWLGELVETTLAVVFDSRETPELAGFRGMSDAHHLTFSGGTAEIDVLVEQEGDTRVLRGQVMGADADAVASVSRDGRILASAAIGSDGAFSLALGPQARDVYVKSSAGALRLCGLQ